MIDTIFYNNESLFDHNMCKHDTKIGKMDISNNESISHGGKENEKNSV